MSNKGGRTAPGSSPGRVAVRRRLPVDRRREQLIALGLDLFSTRGYEEVSAEEIAERGGISRGLLYHYFPTKRDFFVAVAKAASLQVAALTQPDPALPAEAGVRQAIGRFLSYAETHPHGFLATYRGSVAGDAEVRAVVEEAWRRHEERILLLLAPGVEPSPLLRMAVRGWLAFAREVTAVWLESRLAPGERIIDLLQAVLFAVVRAAGSSQ